MKVSIKSLEIEMPIKQNGIELEVRSVDGKQQLGDCYATMTGLTWCSGKTQKKNGVRLHWEDFQDICKSNEILKIAVKAAKDAIKSKGRTNLGQR